MGRLQERIGFGNFHGMYFTIRRTHWPFPSARGQPGPQTNDVDLDARGLIYLVDRGPGLNILEFKRPN